MDLKKCMLLALGGHEGRADCAWIMFLCSHINMGEGEGGSNALCPSAFFFFLDFFRGLVTETSRSEACAFSQFVDSWYFHTCFPEYKRFDVCTSVEMNRFRISRRYFSIFMWVCQNRGSKQAQTHLFRFRIAFSDFLCDCKSGHFGMFSPFKDFSIFVGLYDYKLQTRARFARKFWKQKPYVLMKGVAKSQSKRRIHICSTAKCTLLQLLNRTRKCTLGNLVMHNGCLSDSAVLFIENWRLELESKESFLSLSLSLLDILVFGALCERSKTFNVYERHDTHQYTAHCSVGGVETHQKGEMYAFELIIIKFNTLRFSSTGPFSLWVFIVPPLPFMCWWALKHVTRIRSQCLSQHLTSGLYVLQVAAVAKSLW